MYKDFNYACPCGKLQGSSKDGLLFFMRTYIYIDGFNLYYGCLKGTPYKWLDLDLLAKNLLDPKHQVLKIKYFTARVSARPHDRDIPQRQNNYFRALKTISNLEIIEGHYLSHVVKMPLAHTQPTKFAEVIKTEEKGSDVNLASHMLFDGFKNKYDCAVVISNDSDLVTPVKMVRYDLAKIVGVLTPNTQHPSVQLKQQANFVKHIRSGVLQASQFAPVLTDQKGRSIIKPQSW